MSDSNPNIVVIGGGTGSFTVLSSLTPYTKHQTAIVSMADDGGSTGVLRDELGVLPPGDVRQCLVALSSSPKVRDLFNYRFDGGTFEGHSFGNLLLTALEKVTGSFAEAVDTASDILRVRGEVMPATLDNVRLKMSWGDETTELNGEKIIDAEHFAQDPRQAVLSLTPEAAANPAAIAAIKNADIVVIAPGDLYTSLGPLLVIDGFGQALADTKAQVVYVSNLVTKEGQTDGFSVEDHVAEIERFAGKPCIDTVLYNTTNPADEALERYKAEGARLVKATNNQKSHYAMVGTDLIGEPADAETTHNLSLARSLIRHDNDKLGLEIMKNRKV